MLNRRVLVVAALLLLAGTLSQRATATPIRVLTIGDSITLGVVSVPTGPAYVDSLAELLGPDYDVVNIGCGGANAFNWRPAAGNASCLGRNMNIPLDYFDDLVDPNTPAEIATIMLGTNDASIGLPFGIYNASLIQITQGLFDRDIEKVVLMTPPPHPSTDPSTQNLIASYVTGILDSDTGLCATIDNVLCGPNVFELLDSSSDFAPSDVHPNEMGHAKIASALFDVIVAIPEPSTSLLQMTALLTVLGLASYRRGRGMRK